VPLPGFGGNMVPEVSGGVSGGGINVTNYNDNYIHASGQLLVEIENNGIIRGVKFIASDLTLKARNLVVESVQNRISQTLSGMSIAIDFGKENTNLTVTPVSGEREAAWTEQVAQIIGTQTCNIVVKETLELAGAIIASAEIDESGRLTDRGRLEMELGSLITRNIYPN